MALIFAYKLNWDNFYIKINRFNETHNFRVEHFSIRDYLNNLLSPSSTSRPIDYHSLQPGKFSIRVSFPHRQCFYPARFVLRQGFTPARFVLRQGFLPDKVSPPARFHTGKLPHRRSFCAGKLSMPASLHTGKLSHRQDFIPARFLPRHAAL